MKPLIEMMSDRVFWYIQCDNADKKCKKLRQDVKRCHNSSAADLLDVHSKAADFEKAKFYQRMTAMDEKLVDAMGAWCSKMETAAQSINDNNRRDLTPPPSETSSDINLSIEEKMGQMREGLEASMRQQITEQMQKLQSATKEVDESRTSTLQGHTMRESQKLSQLRDSLEASLRERMTEESQKLQCEVKDAYESRTATIQNHAMQESQKLAQMRSNLETVIRKQSAEESQKLECKIRDQYEAQIAALSQDLAREKETSKNLQDTLSQEEEVSKSLQAELKSTNARLAALETKIEDQITRSSQSDPIVKQEAFVNLESRLAKVEAWRMVSNKSKTKEPIMDQKTDVTIDGVQTQKIDRATAESIYLELEQELEDKMTQFILRSGDRIVPDQRVLRLVQPHISAVKDNLQSSLRHMADGFGKMIEKEREMSANLRVQVEAAAQSATASAQAIENMQTELSALQTTSDANRQSDAALLKQQQDQMQNFMTSLASAKRETETAKSELQKSLDSLWLRSTNMHAWQEDFSTAQLFDAIIQHLNIYFVPEHLSSLTSLKARVACIEGQLHLGDASNKKRKLTEHSPFPAPSLIRR